MTSRISSVAKVVSALALALGLSACLVAMSSYKPEAFGRGKTFAVVSIAGAPEITVPGAGPSGMGSTLSGMVKAASSDSGYSNSADMVFAEAVPAALKELEKSRQFRLATGTWVTQHKAYRAAQGDEPKVMWSRMLVYKGYKYFGSEAKLQQLARDLNVDAVVMMTVSFSAPFSGVGAAGLVAAGTHSAQTTITLAAIDRDGNVVWKDAVQETSKDSIGSFGESANFAKLQPMFIDSTRSASRKLLDNLNTKLASR
jgi:hypothetical protein